jgi:hypothetical protein
LSSSLKSKFSLTLTFGLLFSSSLYATDLRYRTSFGHCPSRVAGTLALNLISEFEKNQSLLEIKRLIQRDRLDEKHFISSYKIDYDPLDRQLTFSMDCPEPLMKVQIYKESGVESYEAILVSSGKLFDPTYEVLLRSENKLTRQLPYLAIPVGDMEEKTQFRITDLINSMSLDFRTKLSEVILSDTGDLTIILSVKNRPSSVFMGPESWQSKMEKLGKIVEYMEAQNKIPAVINLTNSEKVVVKFND